MSSGVSMVQVYVGNLSYSVTSDVLRDAARRHVPDATVEVILDRFSGRSKGFGFVTVPDVVSAQRLVDAFNGREFEGRVMSATERRDRRPAAIVEKIADLPAPRRIIVVSDQASAGLTEYFARHPEEMKSMSPRRFEELIAEVFRRLGFEVELTKQTHDGGIDIIAIRDLEVRTRFLIECKRLAPHNKVSVDAVRQLHGVKQDIGGTKAILATTTYFSPDAQQYLDRHCWELEGRDYNGVVSWVQLATRGSQSTR